MIGFILIIFTILFAGFLFPGRNSKNKKIFLFITFFALFLFSGLRAPSVGIDTRTYIEWFNFISSHELKESLIHIKAEQGFIIFMYLLTFLGNAQIFIIISSLFILFAVARTIYKYSSSPMASTLIFTIFIFSRTMNGIRQYMALAIVLLAVPYLVNQKPIKYIICVIIASYFHISALLLVLFSFFSINKVELSKMKLRIIIIISMIATFNYDLIIEYIYIIMPKYERFKYGSANGEGDLSVPWLLIEIAIFILVVLYVYKKEINKSVLSNVSNEIQLKANKIFLVLFLAHIMVTLASANMYILNRLEIYTRISIIFIYPIALQSLLSIKNLKRIRGFKELTTIVITFGIIIFGLSIFYRDMHDLLPYKYFWEY